MASVVERRLTALEDAAKVREGLVVIRTEAAPEDLHEPGLAAWLEAHPPRMSGGVRVEYVPEVWEAT